MAVVKILQLSTEIKARVISMELYLVRGALEVIEVTDTSHSSSSTKGMVTETECKRPYKIPINNNQLLIIAVV